MDKQMLVNELTRDEGKRTKPYRDSVGKLSIGVGRNLDDVGLREDEIALLLNNDIDAAMKSLDERLPWWRTLDEVRQRVLVNMCFNMGISKLLGFKNTLIAIQTGDYQSAASGMLASKWAAQVGNRAIRLSNMMARGKA